MRQKHCKRDTTSVRNVRNHWNGDTVYYAIKMSTTSDERAPWAFHPQRKLIFMRLCAHRGIRRNMHFSRAGCPCAIGWSGRQLMVWTQLFSFVWTSLQNIKVSFLSRLLTLSMLTDRSWQFFYCRKVNEISNKTHGWTTINAAKHHRLGAKDFWKAEDSWIVRLCPLLLLFLSPLRPINYK